VTFRPSKKKPRKRNLADDFETVERLAKAFRLNAGRTEYAFVSVMGREFQPSSSADRSLWDDAWALMWRTR